MLCSLGTVAGEPADLLSVAERSLHRRWRHLDDKAGAILPATFATGADRHRDLIRGHCSNRMPGVDGSVAIVVAAVAIAVAIAIAIPIPTAAAAAIMPRP